MPFISDNQLAKVQTAIERKETALSRAKKKAEEKAGEMKTVAEMCVAAGLLGFIRGKVEASGKTFVIPGTTIDLELVAGLGLTGAALMDLFGKYDDDILAAGGGILSHYLGQVGRNAGKTGSFGLVAGFDSLI